MRTVQIISAFLIWLASGCGVHGQEAGKAAHARQVFDRLVMARGDARTPDPTFVFSPLKRHGASAKDGTITLEETAYDICLAFGERADDALAGILAHELIHYYEGHEWEDGFITLVDGGGTATETVTENSAAFTKDEIEADYLGGFLAHLAGYATVRVMPEVLTQIYATYELPEALTDYPPLTERKAIAEKTGDRLDRLVDAFEVGNLLAALGNYDESLLYYQYLLKEFQSREMYNNTGVLYAMAALDHFDRDKLPMNYAFELDFDSRMETGARDVTRDRKRLEALLEEAISSFTRAVTLDAGYTTGHLNLASAHSLLAHSFRQEPFTDQGLESAEDHLLAAQLAVRKAERTVGADAEPPIRQAISELKRGINAQLTNEAGATPKSVNGAATTAASFSGFTLRESIGGNTVDDLLLDAVEWDHDQVIGTAVEGVRLKTTHATGGGQISKLLHQYGRKGILFLRAASQADGATSLDISVGSPRSSIEREYGDPARSVSLAGGGELLVYDASELIFLLRGGKVATWYLYREV